MTDNPAPRHPLYWLPNALTVSRILSIPFIMAGILGLAVNAGGVLSEPWVVGGLFVLAGLTDFLDGFLARRWNLVSGFGRMIDPIADKLLVAGCLIAFCIVAQGNWIFLVPAVAIIFRDILVSGAREHAALENIVMPPTKLAKWKTACEMLAIAALILWLILRSGDDAAVANTVRMIGLAMLWLAAILSVYTGSLYLRAAVKA